MAVDALVSLQLAEDYRKLPVEEHGKIRFASFEMPPITVASDAGSTIDLVELPAGRVRVLPSMSRVQTSAFGASRILDIGHTAYASGDNTTEAYDDDAFTPAHLDIASATADLKFGNLLEFDLYSKAGVLVQAKVTGGTIPIGATLKGFIAYVYE